MKCALDTHQQGAWLVALAASPWSSPTPEDPGNRQRSLLWRRQQAGIPTLPRYCSAAQTAPEERDPEWPADRQTQDTNSCQMPAAALRLHTSNLNETPGQSTSDRSQDRPLHCHGQAVHLWHHVDQGQHCWERTGGRAICSSPARSKAYTLQELAATLGCNGLVQVSHEPATP